MWLECCGVWPHWKNEIDKRMFKQMASIWMFHLHRIAYEYLSFYLRICIFHCMSNQKKLHKHHLPLLSIHNLHREKITNKQKHFFQIMLTTRWYHFHWASYYMLLVSIKCFHLLHYRMLSMTIHSFQHYINDNSFIWALY